MFSRPWERSSGDTNKKFVSQEKRASLDINQDLSPNQTRSPLPTVPSLWVHLPDPVGQDQSQSLPSTVRPATTSLEVSMIQCAAQLESALLCARVGHTSIRGNFTLAVLNH